VDFNGAGTQSIPAFNFNNLTSSSGGARTLASSGTIGVAGTFTPGGNTYTITGSTVNFNGAGAQVIPAFNFNHLASSGSAGRTLASSGTIGVADTFTPGGNPYTITGSTVDFNGAGPQTIPAFNYNNLTSSSGGARTLASSGTIGVAGAFTPGTNSYTITGSTVNFNGAGAQVIPVFNFNNLTSSSTGGRTLASGGTIGVAGTFTPGTNAYTIAGSTVDFNGASTQTIPAFNFNNLTSSNAGARTLASSGTIGVAGTFTPGGNPYTITGSTVDFNGAGTQTIPVFNFNNLTSSGSAGRILASGGTTGVAGTFAPGTNPYTIIGSTVDFNGTGTQTIPAFNFNNLTSSNAGPRTLASSGTIGVAGTFTPGTNSYTITGSTVDFNGAGAQVIPVFNFNNLTSSSGGARTLASGGTIGVAGTFTPGTNPYTITGSTVNFNGAGAQVIPAFNFNNLTSSGSAGRVLASSGMIGVVGVFTPGTNPYTITGSTVDFNGAGAQTIPAFIYNDLSTSNGGTKTSGGPITLNSNLVIGDGTTFSHGGFALTVTGTTTVGGGTSGTLTLSAPAGTKTFTGLVTVNSGATWNNSGNSPVTFRGGITNSGTFTAGSGVHTFDTNSQALNGTFTIPSVTVSGVTLTNNNTLTVGTALSGTGGLTQAASSNLNLGGTSGITTLTATAAGNTVSFNGSTGAQTIPAVTFNNLILNNASGASLGGNVTVNGTLTLTNGKISTGANSLILPTSATISGASVSRYVSGNVQRAFTGGSPTFTFPIGDVSLYDPVALTFTGISTPGDVTASVTGGDCSAIGSSAIDPALSVNHCWTLANSGIAFTDYAATFNYGNGSDLDAGTTPASFLVEKYNGATWLSLTVSGTPSGTSAAVTGVTSMSDFAIGNLKKTATTTTVATSGSPSTYGDPVTFTATVNQLAATGTVEFYDGISLIGTGTLAVNGGQNQAAYTTTARQLTKIASPHAITAKYLGDSAYLGSTSSPVTQNVNQRILTISGLTADDKIYNGNADATLSGAGTLNNVVSGDIIDLGGTPSATFADKSAADNKPVTVSSYTISGAAAGNYSLTQPTGLHANITKAEVIPHVTVQDKVYDGTTAAIIDTRTLDNVIGLDDVTLAGGTANFVDPAVGSGKTVNIIGLTLTGDDSGNYQLSSSSATTTATINASISGNAGVAGAIMSFTGGTPVTAGPTGDYTLVVPPNWTGTVTPSLFGHSFLPTNMTYTNVTASFTGQNYTATAITYTISGSVGMIGVTVSFTGGTPVTSGAGGAYTLTVPYNWSGTVTPSLAGYNFTPVSRTYTNVLANVTGQNYTALPSDIVYYVNNTVSCNDGNPGTSPSAPFCTIGQGAFIAAPGNTIRVLAGTYAEKVRPTISGTAGYPITFSAAPGVTVTGAGIPGSGSINAFRLTSLGYITIDGFTITGTVDEGIYVSGPGSNHITVTNNHVSSSGSPVSGSDRAGIAFFNTTDSTISGNTTDHNSSHGIQISGCSNITINNNISFANASVYSRRANGIYVSTTSTNLMVIHNIAYANEDSGLGFDTGPHNNYVIGNLIYGNGDHGIDQSDAPGNIIVGNTIQGNVTAGINLEGTTGSGGATLRNNIVVDNGIAPPAPGLPGNISVSSTSQAGTTLDYNLYYQSSGSSVQIHWASDYTTLSAFQTATGQEAHGLQANPLFEAPAVPATRPPAVNVGDYHLSGASPAIDSANSAAPNEPGLDLDGHTRIDIPGITDTGSGPRTFDDRGAYEHQFATVTLDDLLHTYDGTPKPATVTTDPAGLSVDVTYGGSPTAPTNANSYEVIATVNAINYTGSAIGTLVIQRADQTINVTTHAPASAANGTSFTVAATGGDSGTPIVYSSSGGCTNVGATFTMTSDTVVCAVMYDQAGNPNYNAAPRVTENVNSLGTAPAVTTDPVNLAVTAGATASFTAAASGFPTPVVQWQVSTDGGANWNDIFGATTTTLSFTATISETGYRYRAVFTNTAGSVTTNTATLTVHTVPVVSLNPINLTVTAGTTASFTAAASGIPAPAVQWQVSTNAGVTWDDIPGATSTTLSFPAAASDNDNQYRAIFTNIAGSVTTAAATLTVHTAPAVSLDPTDLTVDAGTSASFTATTSGFPTPTVQWQVSTDGGTIWTDVPGANATTLSFTAAAGDSGNQYRAVFTNSVGSATTTAATLTVHTSAPAVSLDPLDLTVIAGVTANFTATASGIPAPTVQWQISTNSGVNWTDIPGATSTTLSFIAVAGDNGYQYRAVFTNVVGNATTAAATLTVHTGPEVSLEPVDLTVIAGTTASFTAAASGFPVPIVQWKVSTDNGATWTDIPSATDPTLSFTAVASDDGNQYRAVFTNVVGNITTIAVTLTVHTAPIVDINPANLTVNAGATATFTAAASGNPIPTVQWQVSVDGGTIWTNIPGATTTTLSFTTVTAKNGNKYRAVFTNVISSATTTAATLTVNSAPVVSLNPANLAVNAGATASFTAAASGFPVPTVQWQVSTDSGATWTDITGATTTTLSFTAVSGDNGHRYQAIFTNTLGSATTTAATLTINKYTLTVSTVGTGNVASDVGGINCGTGTTCSVDYDYNTTVTLTANTAVGGWSFTGWSGDVSCPGTGTCAVNMTANKSVTASFTYHDYTLTVTSAHGTVVKNPDQPRYFEGDVVQLTAIPATGWTFSGWSGGLTGLDNPGSVTIHGNTAVTANYSTIPILMSPVSGVTLLNRRPVLDWLDAAGATRYDIQLARNTAFTSGLLRYTSTVSTFTPASDLAAGTVFYWRVRSFGAYGLSGFSEVRNFKTGNPPSTPTLVLPASNALTTDYTPRLDWSNSTLPASTTFQKYELQLATDDTFTSPTSVDIVGPATSSEHTPGADLTPNTIYYWRVRAYNMAGEYSSWSLVRKFRTALLPPTLSSPANGAILLNRRPTFSWGAVSGATGYTIRVYRNSAFTLLVGTYSATSATFTPTVDLPADLPLWWRVQSKGSNGPSDWSAPFSIHTANPPSVPTQLLPANNALTTDYTPRLDWAIVTVPLGSAYAFDHYLIQVADNAAFTSPVINDSSINSITAHEFTPGSDLIPNTTYYWRVRAYNTNSEYSSWSLVRKFRAALLPPTLSSPANGAILLNRRPTFSWGAVSGATGYTIRVYRNSALTLLVGTYSATSATFTPTADLPANLTLWWRVQSKGLNGPSAWSAPFSIHTANPPSIPVLVSPASNALTTDYTPRLDWSNSTVPASTTFQKYELQLATDSTFTAPSSVDIAGPVTNSEYTPGVDLNPNTTYYWRVRAYNTGSEYSAWSLVRTFRTAIAPPILLTPADGALTTNRKPIFDWADMGGAKNYTIQVSRNSTFTSLVVNATVTPSTYTPTINLPVGTLYWRVKANGVNGPSLWAVRFTLIEQ
jgi:hypothetical protein